MSEWFAMHELQWLKPALTSLLLAPVPILLLLVIAAIRLKRHPASSRMLLALSICGLWFSATNGAAYALADASGLAPQALGSDRIAAMAKADAPTGAKPGSAIVVLGGGREPWAPEYAAASLSDESLQRLRYGLWLGRQTHLPVAFTGGVGWGQQAATGDAEADIAARVAAIEFSTPLRWIENRSRDTRENARLTTELLRADGIDHVLLVTHGWHMRRALRAFKAEGDSAIRFEAAPMALSSSHDGVLMKWMPSGDGFARFRQVSREALGFLFGA